MEKKKRGEREKKEEGPSHAVCVIFLRAFTPLLLAGCCELMVILSPCPSATYRGKRLCVYVGGRIKRNTARTISMVYNM